MIDPWLLGILFLPLLLFLYFGLLIGLNEALLGLDTDVLWSYDDWAYAPFIFCLGGAYFLTEAPSVPVRFEPTYLAALPLGAAMYWGTHFSWTRYTGSIPTRGGQSIVALAPGLLVPIPEELLFREGLAVLIDSIGPAGYLLVSSIVFGLYHYHLGRHEVVLKTGLGVALGLAYLATGTVLVPILIHVGYNLAWAEYVTAPFS